jgi:hypothetical protein
MHQNGNLQTNDGDNGRLKQRNTTIKGSGRPNSCALQRCTRWSSLSAPGREVTGLSKPTEYPGLRLTPSIEVLKKPFNLDRRDSGEQ